MTSDLVYRIGSKIIVECLSLPVFGRILTDSSRIVHRYSTILQHLQVLQFDAVIDGGANIGEFACLVRTSLPGADLVCVEPQPECADILLGRGFRVVRAALWDSKTTLTLCQPGSSLTSCSVVAPKTTDRGWKVSTIRLDEIPVTGTNILVKLDLQGAEMTALQGMGGLWPRCTALLVEVSFGRGSSYEKISRLLLERQYCEYSTVNEFFENGTVREADKLWVKSEILEALRTR
jgi:FkbM family methyltransferase